MSSLTIEMLQGARGPRRGRADRRTLSRLRELCDEVLASYRMAQGQDLVTPEDRQVAQQVLRRVVPTTLGVKE